jgi:hypothetical protein
MMMMMMMMMYPTKLFEDRASLVLVFINKQSERKDIQKTKTKMAEHSFCAIVCGLMGRLLSFVF